jgi:phage head maturation protease
MDIVHKTTEAKTGDFLKKVGDLYKYRLCSPRVDGYDDVVEPRGLDRTDFHFNPIALVGHLHEFIAGKWLNDRIESDGCLYADLQLAPPDSSPRIRELHALVENNILSACSIGFVPTEAKPRVGSTKGGQHYTKGILREASLVAVPANPDALRVAKSLGVSSETIQRIFNKMPATKPDSVSERIRKARRAVAKAKAIMQKSSSPQTRATMMRIIAQLEEADREQTARYSGVKSASSREQQQQQREAALKAEAKRYCDELMRNHKTSEAYIRSQYAIPEPYHKSYKVPLFINGQAIWPKKNKYGY